MNVAWTDGYTMRSVFIRKNLKRVRSIRLLKAGVAALASPVAASLHRLLGMLFPQSARVGSPKRISNSVKQCIDTTIARAKLAPTNEVYRELVQENVTVLPSVKVLGTPPRQYTNAKYETKVFEWVATLDKARILTEPLAIITHDDTLLVEVSNWYGEGFAHPVFRKVILPKLSRLSGSSLYLRGGCNYFHFLTDVMPKIRLLELAKVSIDSFDHILMEEPRTAFEQELMSIFGLPCDKVIDPSRFKHLELDMVTIPTVHNRAGSWFISYIRDKFAQQHSFENNATIKKRLYVSRQNASSRRVLNEDEVFAFLETQGFEFVIPDKLTVIEQANLFAAAEIVVGPHGAALTNTLFCSFGSALIEFRARQHLNHTEDCYQRLCSFASLNHYLLFCDGKSNDSLAAGHDLDITVDVQLLKLMVHDVVTDCTRRLAVS